MSETHFNIAVRKTIETDLVEAYKAGDSNQVNAKLDIYPGGRPRPNISIEAAHHIAKWGLEDRKVA